MKTAILLTCFVFSQTIPEQMELQVFLCDDGSSDGTGQLVESLFPQVQILRGNGSLFWGGGMRAAWQFARKSGKFDFFLWLNDDTYLLDNALSDLFEDYFSLTEPAILIGSCYDSFSKKISFGGAIHERKVIPDGSLREVELINGNLVLIPEVIDSVLNGISRDFTHYYGDYDYGLRAQKAGFKCFIAKKYLATCDENEAVPWGTGDVAFKTRWKTIHHVKGLALSEYYVFLSAHKGRLSALKTVFSIYFKVLFPGAHQRIRKSLLNS
jgi:GT2 family glycosyltransferase